MSDSRGSANEQIIQPDRLTTNRITSGDHVKLTRYILRINYLLYVLIARSYQERSIKLIKLIDQNVLRAVRESQSKLPNEIVHLYIQ